MGRLVLLLLPFIEAWITGDKRDHHLLQRPRDAPGRTATMVALMTIYAVFWIAGGNDIIAIRLNLSINQITYFNRVAVFVLPVITFWITRRWCISLQRKDREDLLHGYETGIIMRSPEGGYSERHLPISTERAFRLTARDRDPEVLDELPGGPDSNGVEPQGGIGSRLSGVRHRLRMLMYADNVQKPTLDELEEGHHHAEHEHELQAPMEGHAADGHQFDGHHLVEGEQLRSGEHP